MKANMRIQALEVRDFKGIRDVKLAPGRYMVVIGGNNGQGKTSVLDSIWATLGGARAAPDAPVRRGAETGSTRLDLGDLKISARWDSDGKFRLYVEKANGDKPSSPQALLDSLRAHTLDPLAFARMPPAAQAKALRQVAGVEELFARLDAEGKAVQEERRDLNRAVKQDEARLSDFGPETDYIDVPDVAPDTSAIMAECNAAIEQKAENDRVRAAATAAMTRADRASDRYNDAFALVRRIEKELEDARAVALNTKAHWDATLDDQAVAYAAADALVDPDTSGVAAKLQAADALAGRVRMKQEREAAADRLRATQAEADRATARLQAIAAEKGDALAASKLPVPGLRITGDAATLNGVPLSDISTSEAIRLGLEVAAAQGSKLRVVTIKDGSLLDPAAMAAVEAWAVANDMQVWIEVVGTGTPGAVVIEAGRIAAEPAFTLNATTNGDI